MKVLGIFCGRPHGTSELLAKQALLGAQEQGADVELVNLRTINIKPCVGCNKCHDFKNMYFGNCPLDDDFHWLEDKILDSDGLVIVMPCYEKAPPSEFKALMDRSGPASDIYFREVAKNVRAANPERFHDDYVTDERCFKKRPAAFINHGGTDYTTMGLPIMLGWCTAMGYIPVDTLLYQYAMGIANEDDKMDRIKASGAHVAKCTQKPEEEMEFIGEISFCPVCHNNAMVMSLPLKQVRCAVCGILGDVVVTDSGEVQVVFSEEERAKSTVKDGGRKLHFEDMQNNMKKLMGFDFGAYKAKTDPIYAQLQVSKPEK